MVPWATEGAAGLGIEVVWLLVVSVWSFVMMLALFWRCVVGSSCYASFRVSVRGVEYEGFPGISYWDGFATQIRGGG